MPHQSHHIPVDQRQFDPKKPSIQGQISLSKLVEDIRAINSSILIISQKIKFLVRNEKILGRNLLVINKKVKDIQGGTFQGSSSGEGSGLENELASINSKISENTLRLIKLESEIENIKQNYAKAEQVSEMKYVIDSINPLEFATIKDLQEISGKKKEKKK